MLWIIIAVIVSYLIGSIPTAFLYAKLFKGIDIRKHGSGNIGATNALRVLGKRAGITVLIIDVIKGIIPTIFLTDIVYQQSNIFPINTLRLCLGLSCIFGHNWTVFLKFKGGKGVATTLGVLIALSIKIPNFAIVLLLLVIVWFCVFLISRIVSLASITVGLIFPIVIMVFKFNLTFIIFAFIFSIFLIIRHLANIKRLLSGIEPRISFKKP